MPVPSTVADLSSTASSNYPSGSESIGTSLDDYLRAHAAIIKQVSDAKADTSHTQAASSISDSTAAGRTLLTAADAAAQRTALGLTSAATTTVGTAANNLVQLDGSAKLPAVDGSQLTNLPINSQVIVDRSYTEYTAATVLSTTIPFDDTVPLSTEGTQVLSLSITPKSATNRFRVRVVGRGTGATANDIVSIAIFDGTTCKQVTAFEQVTNVDSTSFCSEVEYVTGDTSAHTISVRVGAATGNCYLNAGPTGVRSFGGTSRATLTVEEIAT